MGEMADMLIENEMFGEWNEFCDTYGIVTRSRDPYFDPKKVLQRKIIDNEKNGLWQIGKKAGGQFIKFGDLTWEHMENIYKMLKRMDIYIPQYIKNFVETKHTHNWLTSFVTKESLVDKNVLVLSKDIDCSNCPLVYFNAQCYDEDAMFGSGIYGDDSYHCKITDEDVDYQYKNKHRGWKCPLKDVE